MHFLMHKSSNTAVIEWSADKSKFSLLNETSSTWSNTTMLIGHTK